MRHPVTLTKIVVLWILTASFAGQAFAQLDSCTVNVTTPGTLGVSADQTSQSSENVGGIPVSAIITTNSTNSQIQVIAPSSFVVGPADADTNTVFATKYGLSGATTANDVNGTTLTALNSGINNMSVDASATKTSGAFSAGTYSMVATIRCSTP